MIAYSLSHKTDFYPHHPICGLKPFFFSAKKRQLRISDATGNIIEQQTRWHFETAKELISLIHESLGLDSFRGFHGEGLIVVDNLETLPLEERKKVKQFVETQTPTEMQFLLTSRNNEEYESNKKLSGFEVSGGEDFICAYIEENVLDLQLDSTEIAELLKIAKGNTLVLVLCLRRLSRKLIDLTGLAADFSSVNVWKKFRANIASLPPNAYEAISDFMFKDTFEQIEVVFSNIGLFYKILKVFAVISGSGTDLSTICLLTEYSYPEVEAVVDTLCNYLIVERKGMVYSLNQFAETYIIQRFLPDAETFNSLSSEITDRCHVVDEALNDAQLGRFCAENGFCPGLDDLPDEVFDLLDFEHIGRQFRQEQGGVFTNQGYVQRHDELRQVYKTLDLRLKKPAYTILAETYSGARVELPYPPHDPMGTEPVRCVDCAAPSLIGLTAGMESMNLLARRLVGMEPQELTAYKALLGAVDCKDLSDAGLLADTLDKYIFSSALNSPEEVAEEELGVILCEDTISQLIPYVDLRGYGQSLLDQRGGVLTPYGLLEREDGQPVQSMNEQPEQGGMEMRF